MPIPSTLQLREETIYMVQPDLLICTQYTCQTQKRWCFIGIPINTRKRAENMTSFYDKIQGTWIADETLSRVFDISPQSKQKLRSKLNHQSPC